MSVGGSEAEREFFRTGAKLYLDIDDALQEFRRQVQEKCARVVNARLRDIGQACQMDWSSEDLRTYQERTEGGQGGGQVGRQLAVRGLGRLYFYLEMYREDGLIGYTEAVCLWRQNANLADKLWSSLKESPAPAGCRQGNELYFGPTIAEHELPDFEKYLNVAIDDFIAFIAPRGGLKEYI